MDYDDAPAEFYDTLMSTLMTDPVMLPGSCIPLEGANFISENEHLLTKPHSESNLELFFRLTHCSCL